MIRTREWHSYVAPLVNGVSVPALEGCVLDSAIEWCARTRVDSRTIRGLDILAGIADIEIPKPAPQLAIAAVLTVWSKQTGVLPSRTRRDLEDQFPKGWPAEQRTRMCDVYGWISTRPAFVTLAPYLTVAQPGEISVEIAVQPARNTNEVPDFLFEHYAEQIAWGAARRLHLMSEMPWADPARAGVFGAQFDEAVSKMGDSAVSGFNKPRLRTGRDVFR